MKRIIRMQGNVGNMLLTVLAGIVLWCLLIFVVSTVFPGCTNVPNGPEVGQGKPEWHDCGVMDNETMATLTDAPPAFDSSLFYAQSVTALSDSSAEFTMKNAYGSEIRLHVWESGDSLLCDLNGFSTWKWLKCVFQGMSACDHHDNPEKYWQCVGIWASGCALGVGWMDFSRMFLSLHLA